MNPGNGRFRLVSANLAHGKADAEAFARLVRALEADVVAVQELVAAQADALGRVMPFGRLDPARDYKGMGIALRSPGTVGRIPLPYRAAYAATLGAADGPGGGEVIEIVNVHIAAPHAPPFGFAFRHRDAQVRALEEYLDAAPAGRRAVVGDLNATPLWPVYRRLAARLTDAAVEAARGNGGHVRATWGPWPGSPRLLRIDHVFVSGLAVRRVRVVPIEGSDHSAVVVDLLVAAADR